MTVITLSSGVFRYFWYVSPTEQVVPSIALKAAFIGAVDNTENSTYTTATFLSGEGHANFLPEGKFGVR